jgi:PAS domain S-box-containing protein
MNARILIIDDEESIRFSFMNFLSKEGHEVLSAADFESALEIISEKNPDLIIADIVLGAYSGIDILRQVKERGLSCSVIMITGVPDVDSAAEAVRLGAFDYLPKPIRKESLLRVTNMALHHEALLREKDRIEAEKERYRRNLEAIFRSLKDAIVSVDASGCIIEVNEAAKNICGFEPVEIIGVRFKDLPYKCNASCMKVLEETLASKRSLEEHRIECRRVDRPNQIVLLNSSPLTDPEKGFMGSILVARDVTRLTVLERELRERHQFHNIVGKSQRMKEIFRVLEDLADTDTTVLIRGESGTGKELVAKALHYGGLRAENAMVVINCSVLAENLLESELFGHIRGAFTGAVREKQGRFEAADRGTIFLDEIGDISPRIQLKLLRVLQEREFERVGDSTPITVDVRVIAATNRNLKEKVRLGEFREDLYYRLKVIEIEMPPLRERREDIPLLVDHFFMLFKGRFTKGIKAVSQDVLDIFMRYPWPGNVRELENAMEHAFVLCRGDTITVEHLPAEIKDQLNFQSPSLKRKTVRGQKAVIETLKKTDWNKAKTARLLGISRQTLYRTIKKYGIDKSKV